MKKPIVFFLTLYLFAAAVYGQSAAGLEKQFRLLNQSLLSEQAVLDSLDGLMENTAGDIEQEKKNIQPDQNKIMKWMSHAVTVSNQIKAQQKKITNIRSSVEEYRNRLERIYTQTIDSLKQLARDGKHDGDRSTVESQILNWTEKRVLISPLVSTLTFDPQRVKAIQLGEATNSLDRTMMEDYLKNVLKEIDSHINLIATSRKEYEDMADLRRRTTEFINEAYEQGRISTIMRSQTIKSAGGAGPIDNPDGPSYTEIQARSVVGLLQQLNTSLINSSTHISPVLSSPGMTQEEYIEILKQAEKQLNSYREIVQKKLK